MAKQQQIVQEDPELVLDCIGICAGGKTDTMIVGAQTTNPFRGGETNTVNGIEHLPGGWVVILLDGGKTRIKVHASSILLQYRLDPLAIPLTADEIRQAGQIIFHKGLAGAVGSDQATKLDRWTKRAERHGQMGAVQAMCAEFLADYKQKAVQQERLDSKLTDDASSDEAVEELDPDKPDPAFVQSQGADAFGPEAVVAVR